MSGLDKCIFNYTETLAQYSYPKIEERLIEDFAGFPIVSNLVCLSYPNQTKRSTCMLDGNFI